VILDRIDLHRVRLPLVRPFRTSSSYREAIEHVLIRVESTDGAVGWGECAAPVDPYYCAETSGTCWHVVGDFLAPSVVGRPWEAIDDFITLYGPIKGNRFARAGLELAAWDALARSRGLSLAAMLGATRPAIESGVSLGIEADFGRLFGLIDGYVAEGYRRVKLKIGPGRDVETVRAVRERYPDLPLQVDANSAYTLDDLDHLRWLDEFGLLLIEQPLSDEDMDDHARLQAALQTPICLDESLHSLADVRRALDLDACRVVNVKPGRVGGLREAVAIHDLCLARGVPAWCGGMHEFGIGRAANVALAALPGFTLPGDVSGSDKYYSEDVVDPPIVARSGLVAVPEGPGLGHATLVDRVARFAVESRTIVAGGDRS